MKVLTNLSLWTKITLLTSFGLALGVGVFSTLGMRAVNEATDAMLQDRLTTASLIADYVDESLARATNELQRTAQLLELRQDSNSFDSSIAGLEDAYARLSIHTYGIYLLDHNGQIIYSDPPMPNSIGLNLFGDPEIRDAVQNGGTTISRMVSAPTSSTPVIFLTRSLAFSPSSQTGALTVAIDLAQSNIGFFIRPLKLGQTGYVEIVDQAGVVISRTEPGPKLQPFEKSDHSGRFVELINAGKPTRGVCHTCHEPSQQVERKDVLAFVPLANTHWGVVVRQSEDEAMAPANKLNQNLIFYGIGLMFIALMFVGITTRDLGSRIKMLTVASRRIASGDLASPVTTLGKDEVGILAQTFDDMRSKLSTSYGNLEQKTRELTSLLSVSEILTSRLDLPDLLQAVVTKAVEVISVADGGLLILEKEGQSDLEVQCAIGLDKESVAKSLPTLGVTSNDPISETQRNGSKDRIQAAVSSLVNTEYLRSKIRSYVSAEIIQKNHYTGSLILVNFRDADVFSASDKRIVQAIADYISIAIERAQLAREADEIRALHEADRLRSQFISSVSHELRTPLTVIKGYATSLLRQNVNWDKETQIEFLKSIDEKTDELRDLIDKILQSAKLEAGALKIEKEPVLLPKISQKVVDENVRWAKNHKFILRFPPSFPVIEADARCIEQVVRNLAENAVKYSPDGGDIVLSGDVKDDEIIFSISDQGVGIPVQYQDKIFERFFRVDSRLTRTTTGSGLGLSICKGHIKAHGGRIWFESTPGKGTTFYFSLPINQRDDGEMTTHGDGNNGRKNLDSVGG